jgi:hypothetical protein
MMAKLSNEEKQKRLNERANELFRIHGIKVLRNTEWKGISTKLGKLNELIKSEQAKVNHE